MTLRLPAVSTTLLALLAALLVVAAPDALQAQVEPGATEEVPPIQDDELRSFARIYLAVTEIRANLERDLERPSGQAEAEQLQRQARAEMMDAVDRSPLTLARYTQIGRILDADPEQRAQLRAVIREIQEKGAGGAG